MASKRHVSTVWTFMQKTTPTEVTCTICKATFRYSKSTSTLIRHLQAKHPIQYGENIAEEQEAKRLHNMLTATATPSTSSLLVHHVGLQPTLAETFDMTRKYSADSERKKALDKLVTSMICTDMQPLTVVEDHGFRQLVHALDTQYVLPSRRDISRRLLPNLYEEHRERIQNEIINVSSVSLTTDIWTSRKTESFLTTTAHFINDNWDLRSVVLSTGRLAKSHTAENIASELKRVLEAWTLGGKVDCIVTDNAANMELACDLLEIRQMPCFAHTLNLVVDDSIKHTEEISNLKTKVKNIVTYFHHSVKASDKLRDLQALQGKAALKLKQDVDTRWNSTYYMLQRYLAINEFVTGALCSLGRHDLVIDTDHHDVIRLSVQALEPFEMATREVSGEKFTTLSKAMPIAKSLMVALQDKTRGLSSPSLAKELSLQMNRRFQGLENKFYPAAATLLDPRFKKIMFSDLSACAQAENRLQGLMKAMEVPPPETSTGQDPEQTPTQMDTSTFWSSFDLRVEQAIAKSAKPTTGPVIEFRRYYEETLIKRNENPLLWWKERQSEFPKLHKLARQFLSAPATSVPSERLFSKEGELISHRRSSLKDSMVDRILFLNENM